MQRSLRVPVAKIIAPFVKTLVKLGVSANTISAVGGIGSIASALYFFPKGDFFKGVIFVCVFVLLDLFDGAVARQSAKGVSKWGALLDSTLDRLSDAAILLGAVIYYIDKSDPLVLVFLIAAFTSFMVSYIRARAESLGIDCNGGIAERSERLIITLTAYGLTGLSVDYAMSIGIWSVAILSIITILQRLMIFYKAVK